MANITITNVDRGNVILADAQFRDELLTFAGADTFIDGTILARQEVAIAVTASAVTGTGNGTVGTASVVAGQVIPMVGAYVLRVTEAVTNGGVWRLEDPNGAIVASGLRMTAGAGAATVFEAAGLIFTITDGSTDFAVGDTATLTVATGNSKLVPFSTTGAGGAQKPIAVLTYDVTKAGAGDEPIRAMVSGRVRKERLVIDGSAAGVGITAAIIDQLRDYGIVAIDVQNLSILDNQ